MVYHSSMFELYRIKTSQNSKFEFNHTQQLLEMPSDQHSQEPGDILHYKVFGIYVPSNLYLSFNMLSST